jgi:hypothetical protein
MTSTGGPENRPLRVKLVFESQPLGGPAGAQVDLDLRWVDAQLLQHGDPRQARLHPQPAFFVAVHMPIPPADLQSLLKGSVAVFALE